MTTVIGALRVTLGLDSSELMAGIASAQASFRGLGDRMKSIGQSMSVGVTAPLAGLGASVLHVAGGFEAAMNRVEAATGASASELKSLSDLAKEMGDSTGYGARQAADAIEMLAKNGLNASQILGGALKASLDLGAAAGVTDLSGAADLATDIMLNFKKSVGELGPVVNGVTGVLLASKFGFDDYRLALAQAGGVAGGLGVSLEDFNATIAVTSAAFASGSDAGTSFKTFLQRLVPASAGAAKAMKDLGLEFFDSEGGMKGMAEIAQELKNGLSNLSDEAKTAALSEIFGTDAMRTAIGLMDAGAKGFETLDAAIRKADASEQAAARMKGFNGEMTKLWNAIEGVQIALADTGFLEAVTGIVQRVADLIRSVGDADPAMLKLGITVAGVTAAIGPVLFGLGALSFAIGAISAPVLAAVAAVGLLAAAGVALYRDWDNLKEQFPTLTGIVENVGAALGDLAKGSLDHIKLMVRGVEQLLSGDLAGALESGKSILTNFGESIAAAFDNLGITGLIQKIPQAFLEVTNAMGPFGESIRAQVEGIVEHFRLMVQGIQQAITGDFGGVLRTGGEMIENFGRTIADTLLALIGMLPEKFAMLGREIMAGLERGIKERWEALKGWFSGLADAIPEIWRERLGIQSPSTVFAEIGGHIMQGLRQGLGSETGTIKAEMENFAQGLGQVFAGIILQKRDVEDSLEEFGLQTLGNLGGGLLNKGFGGLGKAIGIPGFANGTDFAPGGLAIVGERGRELVNLPRGARVHSNIETEGLLRSREPQGIRLFVDRDGNWQAAVERIAGQQVEVRRGAIVGDSVQAVQQGRAMSSRFLE